MVLVSIFFAIGATASPQARGKARGEHPESSRKRVCGFESRPSYHRSHKFVTPMFGGQTYRDGRSVRFLCKKVLQFPTNSDSMVLGRRNFILRLLQI